MDIFWIVFAIPSIIIASTIHEFAHAWTAYKLGDSTAKSEGRLTLNPLVHIDPLGALMLVLVRVGWSKPVPISEQNFENPILGTALTAIAGPISNLLLAVITGIIYRFIGNVTMGFDGNYIYVYYFLTVFFIVNISLMAFNLIPFPPLDGHKIVRALLPNRLRYSWEMLEKYSIFLILLLIIPFSPLGSIISIYINSVLTFFTNLLL
ncbi:MAG TPA: site-2 protease family protein [Candidatus Dojkabacteria bacterium]|nr:site-2 protease family protein [Candidatus Dojkabacteria bacterium]